MSDESIEKEYEKAFEQAGYVQPGFGAAARNEMAQMVEIIAKGNMNINAELQTGRDFPKSGGLIAEEFHAETFNLDATLKGDDARAYTDRYSEWKQQEWHGRKLADRDSTDVVIAKNGKVEKSYQAKFLKDAKNSAGAMSDPKYRDNDHYLGASDQIDGIKKHSDENFRINKERGGDPARREGYKRVRDKVTDKITDGKASSQSLSKQEANEMGKGNLDKLKKIESDYQTASTLKQMGNAAAGAAAMSAVVSGSMNTLRYIQLAKDGKLTPQEATIKILGETVSAAADSAVKASANAGVQSLLVRYGSKEAALQALARQGLSGMLKTSAVTVGVTCGVEAIKDLVKLGMGQISRQEFFDRQGKGVLMTTAGVAGGGIGTAAGAGFATALGASTGSLALTVAEIIGGLSGGMIAGLAMTMAIENGIEKPYRDLLRNTDTLKAATLELERVSLTMLNGQILFTKFIEAEAALDKEIHSRLVRIEQTGQRIADAGERVREIGKKVQTAARCSQEAANRSEMVGKSIEETSQLAWNAIHNI